MFIARQPIFNQNLVVVGYELLFRSDGDSNIFDGISSRNATATVIGGLFETGIDKIVENKYAFINFDENFIHSNSLELIAPDRLIIEILEDVQIDNSLVKRIEEIKDKGYKVALDDFVEDYDNYPLVPLADIIKFDLILRPIETIQTDIQKALSNNKVILAEKIETKEVFLKAKEMGFHLFQGYFFSKPNIVSKSCNKSASKLQYTRLLSELKKEEPSYQALAEIIENDVNLAYRFMRVISTRSGDDLLYSIKRALTYMGFNEIERWINILMLQDLGKSKPKELIKTSLIRTRFAESIALHGGFQSIKHEASMMGLFSILDAILDQPIEVALKDISLPNSILEALIEHKGILYPIYSLIIAYEKGNWRKVEKILKSIKIDENILYEEYLNAIKWAKELTIMIT